MEAGGRLGVGGWKGLEVGSVGQSLHELGDVGVGDGGLKGTVAGVRLGPGGESNHGAVAGPGGAESSRSVGWEAEGGGDDVDGATAVCDLQGRGDVCEQGYRGGVERSGLQGWKQGGLRSAAAQAAGNLGSQ